MWCLERLRFGPECLRRSGDWLLPARARRAKSRTTAACSNVLTPDRIPEFCIPPRLLPRLTLAAFRNSWVEEAEMDEGAGRTDWDPRSQAALSLPHLPRVRTAYGFCVLLESPHTRRKESLLLGDAPAPRPRAHTYGVGGGPDALLGTLSFPRAQGPATPAAPGGPRPPQDALSPARAPSASPPLSRVPFPERLEAEGTVALGRAGDALRLVAEYCPGTRRLRLRLLRAEGLAGGVPGPRAIRCRLSLVLRPPGTARRQCSTVVGRSRKASFDQDFCFDGLSEDEVRRLAVRVKAWDEGGGRERGRLLGQGELSLGALLLI
ncbi:PREDICTED: C2 calcium-dependent domain-containing protein 4A [Rhinopithecus bieti]|uniref:C2 calcium-dependent domain-containing protein 4A n=1 Tax=Rhinopithecus bieti TaxID=61621 RepID=UPI00083BAFE0|nr:PREDICTED: C2 calcium-dependent domain-containing protein 4A [Rhinopithecus bieti]